MGGFDSDLEDLYRRRHGPFQVMLASVTGTVESARDVVQEAFAQALSNGGAVLVLSSGLARATEIRRGLSRRQLAYVCECAGMSLERSAASAWSECALGLA